MSSKISTILLNLGGVVLPYAVSHVTALPPHTIARIGKSETYKKYERSQISKNEFYDEITVEFGIQRKLWQEAMNEIRTAVTPNYDLIKAIKFIKNNHPGLKVCAFSNLSEPDFGSIKDLVESFDLFDSTFTSASLGHRKPELESFEKVLELTDAFAEFTILVDDDMDNILAARSIGIQAIHFDDNANVVSQIRDLMQISTCR